jgi:flagellar assembly protein FliH
VEKSRIPAEQTSGFSNWTLPEVATGKQPAERDSGNKVVARALTARQLEEITSRAHREGFAHGVREGRTAGFAQGQEEGRAAAREELQQHVAQLQNVMRQLLEPIAEQNTAIETAMTQLSLDIARAALDREPAVDAQALIPLVRRAIRELPVGERNITVLLHPQQIERVRDCAEWPPNWRLQPDSRIDVGGCKVLTDHSLVDFSIEMRFRQIAAQLLARQDDVDPPEPGMLLSDSDD